MPYRGVIAASVPKTVSAILVGVTEALDITLNPILARGLPAVNIAQILNVPEALNISLNPILARGVIYRDTDYILGQDWKTFSGIVKDPAGVPVARKIRVLQRSDGYKLGETTSDPVTGLFSIAVPATSEVQVMCLDDEADDLENDLVQRVLPV